MPHDYWNLWQGQLVSQLGTQAFQILALFWLASHTHHAGAGALFLSLSLMPPVFFGPWLARWGSRFSPRHVLVGCDALASLVALPVLMALALGAPVATIVGALLMTNAMLALVQALRMPTLHAVVPSLVPGPRLASANSWMFTTQQLATVMGQALGGLAFAVVGPVGLCVANMAGFAASALSTSRMSSASACATPVKSAAAAPTLWSLLRTNETLRRTTLLSAIFNVLYMPWIVLLPFHLSSNGTPSASTLGLVLAGYGVGNIIGALLLRPLTQRAGPQLLQWALMFEAVALVALGFTHGAVQSAVILLLMGAGIGTVNVQVMTRIQTSVAPELRSAAIAVSRASVYVAIPLGYGGAALAQHAFHALPGQVYVVCGASLLTALIVFRGLMQPPN